MRSLLPACLLVLCLSAPAHADVLPLSGGPKLADCSKARDPARCEARLQARQACRDKRGDNKRMCMEAYMVSPDCARAEHPRRCIAQKRAEQACRGKQGKSHKACIKAELRKKPAKPAAPAAPAPAAINSSKAPQ
ncbi:MAG TPA: hypothetical protein VNZ68_01495 [Rhodocyclaceae bacterium]|nr:hypothetical protein [Rhodocyclaceae bacterium]